MVSQGVVARTSGFVAGLSPNVRGALWMLASALTYSSMTTLIKFLGNGYSGRRCRCSTASSAGFLILLADHRPAAQRGLRDDAPAA